MRSQQPASNPYLAGENARRDDVHQPWEQDNQAWWDWYVSLAEAPASPPDEGAGQLDPTSELVPADQLPDDAAVIAELSAPYPIVEQDIEFFRRNGFVKLAGVLSPAAVSRLRLEMSALLEAAFDTRLDGGTRERFLSVEMVWLDNALIRAFVLSPRLAGIGAALLGVKRLRLYHDNLLSKEPGCGRTPWHFDDHHFPLATRDVVTAWIPAQPIPRCMGPLAFASPIDAWELVKDVPFDKFGTSYDRTVSEVFRRHGVTVEDGPFALGEVSFHHNLSFHTAGPNSTGRSRLVLANTYFVDGARVVDRPTMVSGDWQKFIPDTGAGEPAASRLNPLCWPAAPATGTEPPQTAAAVPGAGPRT